MSYFYFINIFSLFLLYNSFAYAASIVCLRMISEFEKKWSAISTSGSCDFILYFITVPWKSVGFLMRDRKG